MLQPSSRLTPSSFAVAQRTNSQEASLALLDCTALDIATHGCVRARSSRHRAVLVAQRTTSHQDALELTDFTTLVRNTAAPELFTDAIKLYTSATNDSSYGCTCAA